MQNNSFNRHRFSIGIALILFAVWIIWGVIQDKPTGNPLPAPREFTAAQATPPAEEQIPAPAPATVAGSNAAVPDGQAPAISGPVETDPATAPPAASGDDSSAYNMPPSPPGQTTDAPMINSYWKLMLLRGQPVIVPDGQTEPHIVLETGGGLHGSGGCNRIKGKYTIASGTIAFDEAFATTRMACPDGNATETGFIEMLKQARSWSVKGDRMVLMGPENTVSAEFERRLMR